MYPPKSPAEVPDSETVTMPSARRWIAYSMSASVWAVSPFARPAARLVVFCPAVNST